MSVIEMLSIIMTHTQHTLAHSEHHYDTLSVHSATHSALSLIMTRTSDLPQYIMGSWANYYPIFDVRESLGILVRLIKVIH